MLPSSEPERSAAIQTKFERIESQSGAQRTLRSNQTNSVSRANKNRTKRQVVESAEEIEENQITKSFVDLSILEDKKASLHFLAYMLIKLGCQVQLGDREMNFSDLILQSEGELLFVHVHSSNRKEGSWRFEVPKSHNTHYYIFCHTMSNEFFPDIFIATGKDVARWIKKNGKISTKDKAMTSIKNLWEQLL